MIKHLLFLIDSDNAQEKATTGKKRLVVLF